MPVLRENHHKTQTLNNTILVACTKCDHYVSQIVRQNNACTIMCGIEYHATGKLPNSVEKLPAKKLPCPARTEI